MGVLDAIDSYFPSRILILVPIAIWAFYLYCRYKLNYWRRRGVPQFDDSNLIFGDVKEAILMRTPPAVHLGELYHRAPSDVPYFGIYIFHKPCLLIKDPKIINRIMVRDFDNFTDRHFAGAAQRDSTGMLNVFGTRNPTWKYLSKKIYPTFSVSKLKQTLPLMLEPCAAMMSYLENRSINNYDEVLDVQNINYKFTADIFANVAFGIKTDCFNNPDDRYMKYMLRFFKLMKRMVALVTLFFVPEVAKIVGEPVFLGFAPLRKMFWSSVKQREQSGAQRGDFIDTVIKLKKEEQNSLYKFEGDNLLSQAGMFLALETSSYAASFTLMNLARNVACQVRVRSEVREAVARYGWTMEAFNEMKYLDMCLAETVRIHPPIGIIDRNALADYKLPDSDDVIEGGTGVFIPLYGLHKDPKFFEDPESFIPERFTAGNKVPAAYMPYGVGLRKCTASKHAQLHVKIVVSKILLEYELQGPFAGQAALDQRSPFTRAAHGIYLKLRKLNHLNRPN